LKTKIMSAQQAAQLIPPGATVGMSGFTGSGHPKVVPGALEQRIAAFHQAGREFKINLWTGASTAPELDGVLAQVEGINTRLPFQSDPTCRKQINTGHVNYPETSLLSDHGIFSAILDKLPGFTFV
jgi:succinyl-CoA:acetate CoA-transferase